MVSWKLCDYYENYEKYHILFQFLPSGRHHRSLNGKTSWHSCLHCVCVCVYCYLDPTHSLHFIIKYVNWVCKLCMPFFLSCSEVSCHQTPAHRKSLTPSVCPLVWVLPASSKPPSTAPWTSWPRPSILAPTTPRRWLPSTLIPCVWTPLLRGSLSPTLFPRLPHQRLRMTQTLASRTDCGTSQSPLRPLSMVSSFMCNPLKHHLYFVHTLL